MINNTHADHHNDTPWEALTPDQLADRKAQLSDMARHVTQHDGTESAFNNAYWDHKDVGIYVDVVSGEPLFASVHKFDSGTGWPSFSEPIDQKYITSHEDYQLLQLRTEVRSAIGESHLGHVFPDGPGPSGLRYCINSAALRFIPKSELALHGYQSLLGLFGDE